MKKYLFVLLAISIQTAQAVTCEELGDISGTYTQTLEIPGVYSIPNGIANFEIISPNKYFYYLAHDTDIDGAQMDPRAAKIKLVTADNQCTYVDPIYPETNITRIISRASKDQLTVKNSNSVNARVIMVLNRIQEE
jgi:hypothetical protein